MEQLLEQIKAAFADGATDEQRAAGATAAQTIADALSAKPGEPMRPKQDATTGSAAASSTTPVGDIPAGGAPPIDALDVLIAKLASHLPPGAQPGQRNGHRLRVPFVPVPTTSSVGRSK